MRYLLLPFRYPGKAKHLGLLLLLTTVTATGRSQNTFISDSVAVFTNGVPSDRATRQINLTTLHFIKVAGNRINFGFVGNGNVILKLRGSDTCSGRYLCIDNTSLDIVNIYKIYSDGTSHLLYQGGEMVSYNSKRNYVWHVVPVEISERPSFYLIELKAPQKNINIKYEIISRDDLQIKYQAHDRVIFFYTGIVCIITAIIALAFFLFKKAVFAAYFGYVLCVSAWIVSHYGYLFPYVYPRIPVINAIAKPLSSLGACFFLIITLNLVFRQYTQSKQWLQAWIKWMLYILVLLAACMFLLLFPGLDAQTKRNLVAGWHIGLLLSICIIVFIPVRFIKSSSSAKIFSAATVVICIMSIVQLFANSGYINNYFISEHGVTTGSLLEISIMAFGLIYSLLEEMKKNEKQVFALRKEQTETLKKFITVQDHERKRIACDLHDNIGPLLASLKINFGRIIYAKSEEMQVGLIEKTEAIIDDSIIEIRNVAHNLMPKNLSSKGLINSLTEYFECTRLVYHKTVSFHHKIQSILNSDLQLNIYRIVCELVLNAVKHSNARVITISINADEKCVSVIIHDDGQGFQQKAGHQKKLFGLQSAESRVLYLKGKFSLRTEPGKGTEINMEIPLQFYEPHLNGF